MNYLVQLYDLIGKEIEMMTYVVIDNSTSSYKKTKWKVIAAYPHHVLAERTCENGTIITECFTKGELVQMGILQSRKKSHYMVGEREGTRWYGKERG